MNARRFTQVMSSLALASASFAACAADHVFSNTTSIAIPASGTGGSGSPSNPYPSAITVAGLTDDVDNIRVTLHNMSHTFTNDIDIMLVSPTGQQVMLMSDMGSSGVSGVTLTFSATAATTLPQSPVQITSGIYLPTNGIGAADIFPAPAPAPTGATDMTVFNGSAANANGTWSLYVTDDFAGDIGSIAGGWTLTFADVAPVVTCASEGYSGTKLTWCTNICEMGYTGATLNTWIRRWVDRYRDLPYCAAN